MVLDTKKLTPIKLYYAGKSIWRVPLRKHGDYSTLYVKTGFTRSFTNETLPDYLKSNMAMILAIDSPNIIPDNEVSEYNVFKIPISKPEWFEIGWQISASWFCMCMRTEQITSLKGITNEDVYYDDDDDDDDSNNSSS